MWKKDLKLHRNLSLTITDKTSCDIPTLATQDKDIFSYQIYGIYVCSKFPCIWNFLILGFVSIQNF